jgi:hypothetical protein
MVIGISFLRPYHIQLLEYQAMLAKKFFSRLQHSVGCRIDMALRAAGCRQDNGHMASRTWPHMVMSLVLA